MIIQNVNELKNLGTILGIWAHPDDETFMSAGLLAACARNGQNVICITATRGEAGVQDPLKYPGETLGATRALELAEALRILGVHHHEWLHYKDGGLKDVPIEEAIAKLKPIVEKFNPDAILTFPPDGITGHEDHKAVSKWVKLMAARFKKHVHILHGVNTEEQFNAYFRELDDKFNIYFNVEKPKLYRKSECDLVFDLPEDIMKLKGEALKAMPSQYSTWLKEYSFDYICKAFATEAFILAPHEDH